MSYLSRTLFTIAAAFICYVPVNAQETVGKDGSNAEFQSKETRDFIQRLDARSEATRDADLAGKGDESALSRLRKAAEQGDGYAEFHLGLLYMDGKGVPQNAEQGIVWLRKSGEQGYAVAQDRLSSLYEKGKGVPKDLPEAAEWARRAAEQGDTAGAATLAMDYYKGKGVPKDDVQAIKWFTILNALAQVSDSEGILENLNRRAEPRQVAEGQALAREWLATYRGKR
jgi:TPR repeat protein